MLYDRVSFASAFIISSFDCKKKCYLLLYFYIFLYTFSDESCFYPDLFHVCWDIRSYSRIIITSG